VSQAVDPPAAEGTGSTRRADGRRYCFHCGEICSETPLLKKDKAFCCQGCLLVRELLLESGLEHFYDLNPHPGMRVSSEATQSRWTFLDDPALQSRLLDFSNGRVSRITLRVPAIHCVACVWLLENLFRLRAGIGQSRVNFMRRRVTVEFAPAEIKLSELVALLASIGYAPELTLEELGPSPAYSPRRRQWIQLGVAGFAFGNIMLFSIPTYFGLDSLSGPMLQRVFGFLSLALAVPVLVYSASDYWRSAWFALRRRALTLDVPIALGLAALFAQSVLDILGGRGVGYLDSLVGLVFFLLCGRAFQQVTHERLAFDRDYRAFFPLAVTRQTAAGPETTAIGNLRVGDRISLRNGELVPADARLARGAGIIDYSFVTGESEPVHKSEGEILYAGGRQVGGAIEAEIVKPVSQSYLTSLWDHEAFRKDREDGFQTLTNRFSRRFTILVLAIALGSAVFWAASGLGLRGIRSFAAVLIVACPCALALAAPFTLGTAQRLLARRRVFLRNALVVERLARVDTIVFDKTGTLTEPGQRRIWFEGEPLSAAETGRVGSLAAHSAHPYSSRIARWLGGTAAPEAVDEFQETPGEGIRGKVNGTEVLLGSARWLQSGGVRIGRTPGPEPGCGDPAGSLSQPASDPGATTDRAQPGSPLPGASCVHVAIDGRCRGQFVLEQPLRPEADRLLSRLGSRYEIALVSGDHDGQRSRFEGMFGGASRLIFNQSPLDKLEFVRGLQASGKRVMMVGDGLNDAGALRQSDVGTAVVEWAGTFSPASDVILEGRRVPELFGVLRLARRAAAIVWLSLGISVAYNAIGVGLAAEGMLSPLLCAILMPLSSVSVVLFACLATRAAALGLGRERAEERGAEPAPASPSLEPAF
jgi:Cu+-exporting ATPase